MTHGPQEDRKGLPELADRLREWLEEVIGTRTPEVVPVPVPVPGRRPGTSRRRRR